MRPLWIAVATPPQRHTRGGMAAAIQSGGVAAALQISFFLHLTGI